MRVISFSLYYQVQTELFLTHHVLITAIVEGVIKNAGVVMFTLKRYNKCAALNTVSVNGTHWYFTDERTELSMEGVDKKQCLL